MTEPDKPAEAPTPPTAEPANEATLPTQLPDEPQVGRKPDRVSLLREKAARPREKKVGPVPSVEHEQTYGFGKKIDEFDEEMEKELQEAMGGASDKELYGEPKHGPAAASQGAGPQKGRVFRVHGQDVFIDLPGGRSQGVMPLDMFPEGPPKVGDVVDFHIEGFDRANGLILLSRRGAAVHADWSSVAEGMIVEARVTATNKGGLEVDVNGIRGFMPISHIELFRVENAEQYVNQRLRCMVAEVNPEERNLIVSRRALLDKEREENRAKLWNELAEGQVRQGVVRSVKDFGAFVDLGGVDGLVHISDMAWTRVQDATKVVQPGQSVKVKVLRIDREKMKLSLGIKQLEPSPWDDIETKYPVGTVAAGKVTRTAEFGAFVELEPAVEGLVHISELAGQRVWRVTDVVKVDQEVKVLVLNVDKDQHRISLSIKQALPKPDPTPAEEDEEEEAELPVKPPKPRTTPLRGGTGSGPVFPNVSGPPTD
jgi:small subunit ribosomal protein S1